MRPCSSPQGISLLHLLFGIGPVIGWKPVGFPRASDLYRGIECREPRLTVCYSLLLVVPRQGAAAGVNPAQGMRPCVLSRVLWVSTQQPRRVCLRSPPIMPSLGVFAL